MTGEKGHANLGKRTRRVLATATAFMFLSQNFAWAVCADGSTFPSGGYVSGQPPASIWSPGLFTGTAGSIFIPDNSVFEHNDPNQPVTGGGHNWVFDQGTTLCKVIDAGPAGGTPTAWTIPSSGTADCILLPIIRAASGNPPVPVIVGFGDIPFQGNAVTPTCDPTQYVGGNPLVGPALPTNTYFNHLGCSISHGVASTPQTATTYLFVAGIRSGLFSIPLDNVENAVVGDEAGKTVSGQNYYSQIPSGSFLTNAAVSKDGQFAIATSLRRDLRVWGCLNPLGDPGDPSLPINPFFFVPPGSEVPCMEVGSNNLAVTLTTAFGPDNQPYFGGRRVINSFNSVPGSSDLNPVTTAWPNCIWQNSGAVSLADAFANNFQNGCGSAQPNFAFASALITQPNALISHGKYMYTGPIGGTVYQFLVKTNPISGLSEYRYRTYVTGLSIVTGLGTDDALQSLFIFTDPTAVGLAGREFITKLPLCEDMDGELPTAVAAATGGAATTGATPAAGAAATTTGAATAAGAGTAPAGAAAAVTPIGAAATTTGAAAAFTPIGAGTTTATPSVTGGLIIPGVTTAPAVPAAGAGTTTPAAAATTGAGTTTTGTFTV